MKRLGNCQEAFATRCVLLSQHDLSGQHVLAFGNKHCKQLWGLPVKTHQPLSIDRYRHFM